VAAVALSACSSQPTSTKGEPPTAAAQNSANGLPGSSAAGEPLQDLTADKAAKEDKDSGDQMVEPERDVHCKKASDERWLQIEVMGDNGCKLWYTKDTGKKAVAWSSSSRTHCRTSREKMVKRLTGDGFECKTE
jgi:hypothetical protein